MINGARILTDGPFLGQKLNKKQVREIFANLQIRKFANGMWQCSSALTSQKREI